jgi:glycerate-2-kinase
VLERIFHAAVAAAEPGRLVAARLQPGDPPRLALGRVREVLLREERISVVAAGKAAPAMAAAAARALGRRFAGGLVAAPPPMPRLPKAFALFRAGHPVPNRSSLAAGRGAWDLAGRLRPDELLLVLLSGGASSMLVLPAAGVSLADKIAVNRALLRAGVSIAEVNAVRKHLSRLKGGGLLRRAGAGRVIGLLLSDVIGGSPSVIGSGPTADDPTTYEDAWRIVERYGLWPSIPAAVRRHLERGRRGIVPETVKRGERAARNLVIGDNGLALRAAAEEARVLGFEPRIVTASLHGEARRAARRFAARLRRHCSSHDVCFLAGGETTVEVRGGGRGGRNQEFALALVEELRGLRGVDVLAAGTDGRDGATNAAGAFVDGKTADRARTRLLDPRDHLDRNDSHRFFDRLGALFRPGPTGTNVMDLVIATIRGRGRG